MKGMLTCCCIAVIICSCGGKQSKENGVILSTDKMQVVMWDMLLADAFTEKYLKTDSSKTTLVKNAALQKKIFELHAVNRDDFYKSYNYYSSHPDMMRILLDSITLKAERERGRLMIEHYSGNRTLKEKD